MLIIKLNESNFCDEKGKIMARGSAFEEDKCEVCHKYFEALEDCWSHDPDDEFSVCLECVHIISLTTLIKNYFE